MQSETYRELRAQVQTYHMPAKAKKLVVSSQLVVVCGVTAAGKNTIVNYLIEHDDFAYMVSHTTRKPRINNGKAEQNGRDYWFVEDAKMMELVQKLAFVEVKQLHNSYFSGTSVMAIEQAVESGKRPITEIDVQGAQELMAELPKLRPLFVLPPSYDVWMERLSNRGELDPADRHRRLATANRELQLAIDKPQFALIVNHEFHKTVAEIMRGVDVSDKTQTERRLLAQKLIDDLAAHSN